MERRLVFSTSAELVRVEASAVVYITADGNYSTMRMADGSEYVLTLQLGRIEHRLAKTLPSEDTRFIRIGKSLIVNRDYITFINVSRQKLTLSDGRTFRHEASASKEALRLLKELIEKEETK